jgi:hypothetical protein
MNSHLTYLPSSALTAQPLLLYPERSEPKENEQALVLNRLITFSANLVCYVG